MYKPILYLSFLILFIGILLHFFNCYATVRTVIVMDIFENIIIKNVVSPCLAHFARGANSQIINRSHYGLALCISGKNQYLLDGKTYVLEPGNAMLLPQHSTYEIHSVKDGVFPFIDFTCDNFHCSEICIFPLEDPQTLLKEFDIMKDLFLFKESRLKIISKFYGILHALSQTQRNMHNPLAPAIRYIEKHIADPNLSNAALAKEMGISEVYLRKLFATHHNISPKQYILNIRIHKAQQLLTDTDLSIGAIAEQCGFTGPYHFCQIFKKRTGVTPSAYAKQNIISKF